MKPQSIKTQWAWMGKQTAVQINQLIGDLVYLDDVEMFEYNDLIEKIIEAEKLKETMVTETDLVKDQLSEK